MRMRIGQSKQARQWLDAGCIQGISATPDDFFYKLVEIYALRPLSSVKFCLHSKS
jgi:hypothetical protein